jgi:carbonic anhydrase
MKNTTIKYFMILLSAMVIASCKLGKELSNVTSKITKTEESHKKHWDYAGETGPDHWSEIEQNDCGGRAQSPVDIVETKKDELLKPIEFHYDSQTKIHDVINNGHTIQFDFESGNYIVLNGEKYELKQFHFHEADEHTIKGVRYPLVVHMVHVSKDGKYAVVAVMAEEDPQNNTVFNFLEKYLPVNVNEIKKVDSSLNLNLILPEKRVYYTYTGSLTTPPCTEGVEWFIFKNPINVSPKMTQELKKMMPTNNFRNVQPLNGRIIKESI